MRVPVLSLWQPWASLWMYNLKLGETRHFKNSFTGLVVIHATMYVDHDTCMLPLFQKALKTISCSNSKRLPRGCALGTCQLQPAKRVEDVRETATPQELEFGNFDDGHFWWPAANKEPFAEPIPLKGKQSVPWMWDVPEALLLNFDRLTD